MPDDVPDTHVNPTDKKVALSPTQDGDQSKREFWFVPIPKNCRHDPLRPAQFKSWLYIVFGLASTATVSNLYYCQPILIDLANSFGTSYERVSRIPTLAQAGYGSGLLLISPLGDIVKRRPLIILLVTLTSIFPIGLALTNNVAVFEGLTFIVSFFSVTPQVLLPLAVDIAPPHRAATAMSIVLSGLLFGILYARVFGGIIDQFSNYRNIYWMSIGLQVGIVIMLYFFLPDVPRKSRHLSYIRILLTMFKFACTEPILIQGSIMAGLASALFSGFWVTLTFLLGSEPYNLSTFHIGLFGLIGAAGVALAPITGRFVDRFSAYLGILVGQAILLVTAIIYLGGAMSNLAVPIITTFLMDVGQQQQMVGNATRIQRVDPLARARFNAVYVIVIFFGQVLGTQVSSILFLKHGYRITGAFWAGLIGLAILIHFSRGPNQARYQLFGYSAGWHSLLDQKKGTTGETPAQANAEQDSAHEMK